MEHIQNQSQPTIPVVDAKVAKIRCLNDDFRSRVPYLPDMVVTTGVVALFDAFDISDLFSIIKQHDEFTEDNDPYGEHDFGIVKCHGKTVWWKIDYYDLNLEWGSPDSSDPNVTRRVMTIYLPEEH